MLDDENGTNAGVNDEDHTAVNGSDTNTVGADDSGEKKTVESVTYSWVSPKIRKREETEQDRNWSGRTFVEESSSAEDASDAGNSRTGGIGSGTAQTGSAGSGTTQTGGAGQTGGTGQPHFYGGAAGSSGYGSGYDRDEHGKTKKKRHFFATAAGRWVLLVVAAIVFGLIAGLVSAGVQNTTLGSGDTAQNETAGGGSPSDQTPENESAVIGSSGEDSGSEPSVQPSGGASSSATVADVAAKTLPSVVTISTVSVQEMRDIFGGTQDYEVQGAGSGVIVGENDTEMLIATNAHVVENAEQLSVGFNDETAASGSIKGQDSSNDLAIVAVKLSDISEETKGKISIIELGDSDQLALGEQVVAMGNALGLGTSVTSGYISALNRTVTFSEGVESKNLIQTDAAINSGNSGGALVNMSGQLIGINEGRASSAGSVTVDNVGYSIPISQAKPILEEMMNLETREKSSEEEQGYLGITCVNVNSEASEQYNVPVGIYVRSVVSGAAADQAGIRVGDVITELDGRSVTTYEDLTGALAYYKSGEEVELVIYRSDNGEYKEKTFTVKLSSRDEVTQASGN